MTGQPGIAGPAVGDHPRARRGDAGDEGLETGRGEILERCEPDAARLSLGRQLHLAGDQHLADRTAPLTARRRIVLGLERDLGLVGLDQVLEQAPPGRHHRPAQLVQQAVLYDPRPSCACNCSAEIPLEWLVTMCAVMNHVRNGRWLRCITVPAVTDVCFPQAE